MKKFSWLLGLIVLLGMGYLLGLNPIPAPTGVRESKLVPGELLVQFKPSIAEAEARRLIEGAGATVKEKIDPQRIFVVSLPQSISAGDMLHRLQTMPQVAHAELHGMVEALGWDLWVPAEARAEETGTTLGAGSRVRVAVIDTAIDSNHTALQGKTVQGYNFVNNTTNTQSTGAGVDWHGTASTGRVLDGSGDANVEIMPVTVLSAGGSGTWANVIKGINYAVDNGAQIINMSLGGTGYSPLLQEAIDRAVSKGVVVVAASGNTGQDMPFYPAAYRGVISVAATNEAGTAAGFTTYHQSVDIAAPGATQKLLSHGGFRYSQGTSFAAPFIAGLAAMLKSAFPFLTPIQVEQTIKAKANNVYDKNSDRYKGKLGAGFLNMLDVKKWMDDIRAGRFRFPWQAAPQPPVVQPPQPQPVRPGQPWLARGKGHSGNFVVTPGGEVVKE